MANTHAEPRWRPVAAAPVAVLALWAIAIARGRVSGDRGSVTVSVPSDTAAVTCAIATGSPASFEQQPPADDPTRAARGHALSIDYDPVAGEVRLQGEAYLTDGCNETSTERIVYEFAQQRVRAQGSGPGINGGRV